MLVKQPLVNEWFLLLSSILKDLNDCFIFCFPHRSKQVMETRVNSV